MKMVQKEQSNYLLGGAEGGTTVASFAGPIPSKFSQAVADQKLEDKKWRMWVVQVVWVKKHNSLIIFQEDNVSGNS